MNDHFRVIVLNGRPAAGKSEVIDYLKRTPPSERLARFHIAPFEEFDDFPILWERFEDDDIYTRHGKPRLVTDERKYFLDDFFWTYLIERLNLNYRKTLARDPGWHDRQTALIEFSRGGPDAYRTAWAALHDDLLERACIVYIGVSYEESKRKNRRRARPGQEDSILHHSLPDEKLDFYYRTDDFADLCPAPDGVVDVRGRRVPYALLPNEPEQTDEPEKLGRALDDVFARLWKRERELRGDR